MLRAGGEKEMGVAINSNIKDACGNENILCVDSLHPSILVVIIYYSFARCYHGGNWPKDSQAFALLFFTTACEICKYHNI